MFAINNRNSPKGSPCVDPIGVWRLEDPWLVNMPRLTTESHTTSSVTSKIAENLHTPTLVSPPDTKTPPTAMGRRDHLSAQGANGTERAGSEPIDPTALTKALKDMEDAGRIRERTPGASPSRKRQRVYGDRSVRTTSQCLSEQYLAVHRHIQKFFLWRKRDVGGPSIPPYVIILSILEAHSRLNS